MSTPRRVAHRLRKTPELTRDALRIVRQAAPRPLALAVALQTVSAVLVGLQLLIVKGLISDLLLLARDESVNATRIVPQLLLLAAVNFASGAASTVLQNTQRWLGELVTRRMLDRIIAVASTVDLSSFEDPEFYDHLSRATESSVTRPLEMVSNLMSLLLAGLTSLGVMVALLTLEPLLLPLILLAGVPVAFATLSNARQAYGFEYALTANGRERTHLLALMTAVESAKELRVFDAIGWLSGRYDTLTDERVDKLRAFLGRRTRVSLIAVAASALGTALALSSLAWLIATGRAGLATVGTAAIAMQVLSSRLQTVISATGKLVEAGLFLDDLQTFFVRADAATPQIIAAPHAPPARFEGLAVRDVSFAYPGTGVDVLRDVSLRIDRGEVVALVGENGSGKTTLVKLLCLLYEPTRGSVEFNGAAVHGEDLPAIRAYTTVLFQDFVQYHLTVADNIALGRADSDREEAEIREAARQAGADGFIERLPKGFDTRLGRKFLGGSELSGGQWQRLALARAFYRGGSLLIMDEPTAALDPRAEYRLFENMRKLAAGRSVLLISHRFANVRMADRIYVLDGGSVVEEGTHEQLVEAGGMYAELFRLQASAYTSE